MLLSGGCLSEAAHQRSSSLKLITSSGAAELFYYIFFDFYLRRRLKMLSEAFEAEAVAVPPPAACEWIPD